jgi:phosphoenolpyruvate-protein kinase (PTS system EI component)
MTAYRGLPVSKGVAAGQLYLPDASPEPPQPPQPHPQADECAVQLPMTRRMAHSSGDAVRADEVRAAFATVAAERAELAERLRADGRHQGADIVFIGALIAADPALIDPAVAAVRSGVPALTAVRDAVEAQASILDALPDPDLALRAGDVRQVGEAVIGLLTGASPTPPDRPFILVGRDVDPADLIRLADADLVGVVSVRGGASSHSAIIARGLGLPMIVGADEAVLAIPAGRQAIVDAVKGQLVVDPSPADLERVPATVAAPGEGTTARHPRTADGEFVTVLCNVASAAETRLGLGGGAAGVGLLRTEIPFTHACAWPTRDDHLAQLMPILGLLDGRKAVVRLLDFSGDKIPPFPGAEGLHALLDTPGALRDQLDAILEAGAGADLAVMIPMVRSPDEVERVRAELSSAAKGADTPPLGIMVEVAATAAAAERFAPHVDFFSIGTNDLSADILHRDRTALLPSAAAEPPVLAAIAHVVRAARQAGIGVSVCGDAAADPAVLPLLIAAGIRTVSVGAARVPDVKRWITQMPCQR